MKCDTEKMKWNLLKKAKSLNENERFKYVFIQPDLKKSERDNIKKLEAELKEKRLLIPSTKYKIKGKLIVENKGSWLKIFLWNVEGAKETLSTFSHTISCY